MPWDVILLSVAIFFSRVVDVGMGTIRVQMIVRRRKYVAALIGFFEILIYILVVSQVISGMHDLTSIVSWVQVVVYAAGFATGTLMGVFLSERMARGVVEVTVIGHEPHDALEAAVREAGFALTRYSGVGRQGRVAVLSAVVSMGDVARLVRVVTAADPDAFVYTQELAGLRGGYVYGVKSKL